MKEEMQSSVSQVSGKGKGKFIWLLGILVGLALYPWLTKSSTKITDRTVSPIDPDWKRWKELSQSEKSEKEEAPNFLSKDSPSKADSSQKELDQIRKEASSQWYLAEKINSESWEDKRQTSLGIKGKKQVLSSLSLQDQKTEAYQVEHPEWIVPAGTVIKGVLHTAITTELSGLVKAEVTQPVYGWVGRDILIPTGTQVLGEYQSSVLPGQERVFIIWTRLLLPEGISIKLSTVGTDVLGRSGLKADEVKRHFWARFGQATLLSVLRGGISLVGLHATPDSEVSEDYRVEMAQSVQQSAGESLTEAMGQAPTLSVHPGAEITLVLSQDLSFEKVRSGN